MDNSGIETIQSMAISAMDNKKIDGREYSITELNPMLDPTVKTTFVYSLDSLINAIKTLKLEDGCFCHVTSPTDVWVSTIEIDQWKQRESPLKAAVGDLVDNFEFGKKYDQEQFLIDVQGNFEKDDNRDTLLKLSSEISLDDSSSLKDDGTTQTVSTKKGVTLMAYAEIPNPMILRPFKSFPEIMTLAQSFVFRVSQGGGRLDEGNEVRLALHASKSRAWEMQIMSDIRLYLSSQLPTMAII